MHIEGMTPEEIIRFELPTGTPHVYDFDTHMVLQGKQVWEIGHD